MMQHSSALAKTALSYVYFKSGLLSAYLVAILRERFFFIF